MKVLPKNDDVRKYISHPSAGPFRPEGPADWPEDQFTFRMLEDGTVTKVEDEPAPPAETPSPPPAPAA